MGSKAQRTKAPSILKREEMIKKGIKVTKKVKKGIKIDKKKKIVSFLKIALSFFALNSLKKC
jgi:hypothetical protein